MLEVQHLSVNYRGISAIEDVSFQLRPGELVGVIGPNGAGKSTMIKAILGLTPAESGVVRFRARALNQQLASVAYVPQRSQVDWDYPVVVHDVVMMARTLHTRLFRSPSHVSQQVVKAALQRVGFWVLRDGQFGVLSGGLQQRVFLATALAQEAELFFFDEPFVGVDKKTEAVIFEVFAELKASGKSLMVISHDLGSTLKEYDRFLLLNKQLIAIGSRDDVITASNIRTAYGGSVILLQREEL
ncbi:MAG: metal ABC transporter ATP-binding protein [Phormidesmis sp. CAN_BIN44]|nr:metal ABC transporter ATP-binding protein [Phormidesmis sp. CAN_BIN44]